jgi:hypothetical protein
MVDKEIKEIKENHFYSFRKIMQEDKFSTTLNEFMGKMTLLLNKILNVVKQSDEKLTSDWSEEFHNLIVLAEDIIENRCEKEPDSLYGYGGTVEFDIKLIIMAKRVALARLACFLVDHQEYLLDNPEKLLWMVQPYLNNLVALGNHNFRDKYTITQFILSSRGLLDNDSTETSTNFVSRLMQQERVRQHQLNEDESKIFEEVNKFWKDKVIGSKCFENAIEKFIQCYELNITAKEVKEHLNAMEIDFVQATAYYGM